MNLLSRKSIVSIGLGILMVTFSCKKENIEINNDFEKEFSFNFNSKIPYSSISLKEKGFVGKFGSDKVLVFPDMKTFLLTLNELERQMLEYDSAFVTFFSSLDEEALNTKEKEIGFRIEQPLINFSDFFEYYSLFKRIDEEEKTWLNNVELDLLNDPDDHFIFDEELRAMLNVDNEVQIGNIIYKFTEDGYYEILDGDLKSLMMLDQGVESKNINFIGDFNDKSTDCKSNKTKSGFKESGSKKIKWKVAHLTYPWDRYVKTKTKNYKKETFLGITYWSVYRTQCSTRVYGYISGDEGDCSTQLEFNTSTGPFAYESKAKWVKQKVYVLTKTKSGWVKGHHNGAGGITYSSTLIW